MSEIIGRDMQKYESVGLDKDSYRIPDEEDYHSSINYDVDNQIEDNIPITVKHKKENVDNLSLNRDPNQINFDDIERAEKEVELAELFKELKIINAQRDKADREYDSIRHKAHEEAGKIWDECCKNADGYDPNKREEIIEKIKELESTIRILNTK